MNELKIISENDIIDIYEKYPFLEEDFWNLLLKKYPDMAVLIQQLGFEGNKQEIARILDTDINKIFRERNEQMSKLAIDLSSIKMVYKNFINNIKNRGKEAISVGAYEDIPYGLLDVLLSAVIRTYSELLQLYDSHEEVVKFPKAYPIFEISLKGYGIKEDKISFGRFFIRRWFNSESRKNKSKEYEDMIDYFTNKKDTQMIELVNLEYNLFNNGKNNENGQCYTLLKRGE